MQSVFSPDQETFLTPPSTPTITESDIRPSLSRRSSRPSSLRIEHSADHWKPDIILDNQPSPDSAKNNTPSTATASSYANGVGHINRINGINGINGNSNIVPNGLPPSLALTPTVTHQQFPQAPVSPALHRSPRPQQMAPALTSPCFVHSQLQGASFSDWLKAKHAKPEFRDARLAEPSHKRIGVDHGDGTHLDRKSYYVQDDDEGVGSLTKQLAETAVGVREMSKQLGRTRVHSAIQSVLIVTKARDNRLINLTRQLALYLMLKPQKGGRGLIVYVDTQLKQSRRFDAASIEKDHPHLFIPYPRRRPSSNSLASTSDEKQDPKPAQEGQLRYWTADMCSRSPDLFDFVVTLGGDGTVLFTSWLFQRIVPPVIPFALGSLGFLTNFDFDDHQSVMDTIIESGIRVNLRMRFTCTVYRAVSPREDKRRRAVKKGDTGEILMKNLEKGGWEALENGYSTQTFMGPDGKCPKDKEIMCFTTRPVESFEVLNDLVVDRGPSPYVSLLELFGDEHHLTTVQADGLTISTPTGSTAYSLSAGGSLVHPEIPAILITPICPHTLSFRPMLLPDSIELRICVPFNSRSTAWASFDGRGRVELKQGDHIKVTASKYPFPTVCADSQSTDWFHSISRTLKWNERERQKSFVVVEEGPSTKKDRKRRTSSATESSISSTGPANAHVTSDTIDDEEDEVSSEEEEKFDIDDLSSNESPKTASSAASAPDIARVYGPNEEEETLGREKMLEDQGFPVKREAQAEAAARSLLPISPLLERPKPKPRSKSRSRSRSGRSGLETPDRFAGPHPHPPKVSPRHVQFMQNTPSSSSSSIADVTPVIERDTTVRGGERGSRDDIHSPSAHGGGKSRIPISRDLDAESQKTPTMSEGERRWKSKEREYPGMSVEPGSSYPRRAFAVWGQDESDSAASDSDA